MLKAFSIALCAIFLVSAVSAASLQENANTLGFYQSDLQKPNMPIPPIVPLPNVLTPDAPKLKRSNADKTKVNLSQSDARISLDKNGKAEPPCKDITEKNNNYTVCKFDLGKDKLRLFHRGRDGEILGSFAALEAELLKTDQTLRFAMNAGMYDRDFKPIGLYIEKGKEIKKINHRDGYGNFHLKPNGVFYLGKDGKAGVMETGRYSRLSLAPDYATQSGPMLVIDGALHPKFIEKSTSKKRRNGVGVSEDGKTLWFVISNGRVNFYDFGSLFRDRLKTKQALFLDGTISKLYAPNLSRHDKGIPLGPMVGAL